VLRREHCRHPEHPRDEGPRMASPALRRLASVGMGSI
jgi:hypothetical protein